MANDGVLSSGMLLQELQLPPPERKVKPAASPFPPAALPNLQLKVGHGAGTGCLVVRRCCLPDPRHVQLVQVPQDLGFARRSRKNRVNQPSRQHAPGIRAAGLFVAYQTLAVGTGLPECCR